MKVFIFVCFLIKYVLTSLRTALILHWIDSTRCWKHPSQISIHVDMLLQIYCLVLMQFSVFIWQKSHPVWSSAVVHLLQGSICCISKSALVHTLVAISGYKCFPVSLKQSGHFHPDNGYFLFFSPVNPGDGCLAKSHYQKNKCKCSVVYTPKWNSLLKFDWLDFGLNGRLKRWVYV